MILDFLNNFFLKRRLRKIPMFELKYFEKYWKLVENPMRIRLLMEQFKKEPIIFEPARLKIPIKEQEILFDKIDNSEFLSPQERMETIIGFMMLLDGSFPEKPILNNLEKIFGKELIEIVNQKKNEFKKEIAVKELINYIKNHKFK